MFLKRKAKQLIEYLSKGRKSSECNDLKIKALLEAGERIERSKFHSSPASDAFKAKLLAKIKEERRLNQVSMQDKIALWVKQLFSLPRWSAVVAFVVLVAVVVTSIRLWPGQDGKTPGLFIDAAYAHDNFEVEPTKSDSLGVEADTSFTIKSKVAIDKDVLLKNLTLVPEVRFDLEQINDKEFKVVPKEQLQGKKVYRVYITSSYVNDNGITTPRNYSWAFQVKDTFKVMHTLPRDKATGVPTNSGIEVTFSHDSYTNFEKHFSITPKATGRFEYHGRTAVFVPKELKEGTIYTVAIKKGVALKSTKDTLKEDLTFQFETVSPQQKTTSDQGVYFHLVEDMIEYGTMHQPALPLYGYYGNNNYSKGEFEVDIYAFKSVDDFVAEYTKEESIPYWAEYGRSEVRYDKKDAKKLNSLKLTTESYGSYEYLVLPDKLPAGFYLIEVKIAGDVSGRTDQMLLQVTDLASYVKVTKNQTIVWVNSLKSKNPSTNSTVEVVGKKVKATTDSKGVVTFKTTDLFSNKPNEYSEGYFVVRSSSQSAVVPFYVSSEYGSLEENNRWSYLYTDRHLYQPNDTVQVWGFLKNRDKSPIKGDLQIRLSTRSYNYYGDPILVAEQTVPLDEKGYWTTALPIKNLLPGTYDLQVLLKNDVLSSTYITVEKYIKPAYSLEVSPRKKALFVGEKTYIDVRASFFEGTPVVGLELTYSGNSAGKIKTDENGRATIEFVGKNDSYYGSNNYITVEPTEGEAADIQGYARVQVFDTSIEVFPKFEQVNDKQTKLTVQVNHVDLGPINRGETEYEHLGKLAENIPIKAIITETTYEKVEIGQEYDFINKITKKTYEYRHADKQFAVFQGTTDTIGTWEREVTIDKEKSYSVAIEATDPEGRIEKDTAFLYTSYGYEQSAYDTGYTYYNIKIDDDNTPGFSIGEKVKAQFTAIGSKAKDSNTGQYLFVKLQNGIQNYSVLNAPTYEFNFEEKDIPNVFVSGIWFDGTQYHASESGYYYGYWEDIRDSAGLVNYNIKDRELQIKVTANKQKYEPGEEVRLQVEVRDKDNQPVEAQVNLNLVDEAFYALSYDTPDPLHDLYTPVASGDYYSYVSHKYLTPPQMAGAEGGGCFLGGTKILMADGTEKNIEDVKEGDVVFTFENEYSTKLVKGTVNKTFKHIVKHYLVINDRLYVTPEHRVFVNHTWRTIGEAKVGDILLDANGSPVRIESIRLVNAQVPVYNFEVKGLHTYIANGIYVHNEKGGARQYFVDVALFKSVQTNHGGEATVTFTLPDNITSWRVTSQAISPILYAGLNTTKIPVSLPLFAEVTHASEYLVSDKPIIKARAYGDALRSGDKVQFSGEAKSLNLAKQTKDGEAFKPVYFPLEQLTLGEHAITVEAQKGQNKDKITKKIQVISSRAKEEAKEFYDLKTDLEIKGADTDRTKLVFMDKNRGRLYADVLDLQWTYGSRIDQKLSRVVGDSLRESYFKNNEMDMYYDIDEELVGSTYQTEDGGITLLPYSGSELELSAKVSAVAHEHFDEAGLKGYFYTMLENKSANRDEIVYSLFGLATLDEPMLNYIKNSINVEGLTVSQKLYLALAAERLGDKEFAQGVYEEIVKKYGEEYKPYARLQVGKNKDENTAATALAAWLGAAVDDVNHEKFWQYTKEQWTKDILINLEELVYLKLMLPNLPSGAAEFTVELSGKKKDYKVEYGNQVVLSVTPEELSAISFSNIKGNVGVVSVYDRLQQRNNSSKLVSVKREFSVNGEKKATFKEGDLIKISLFTSIDDSSLDGRYELTDYLPSGLKLVSWRGCYPFEVNGQEIKFGVYKTEYYSCERGIEYYARVVSPGTYTAEPAIIQSMKSAEIKNFSTMDTITITP